MEKKKFDFSFSILGVLEAKDYDEAQKMLAGITGYYQEGVNDVIQLHNLEVRLSPSAEDMS